MTKAHQYHNYRLIRYHHTMPEPGSSLRLAQVYWEVGDNGKPRIVAVDDRPFISGDTRDDVIELIGVMVADIQRNGEIIDEKDIPESVK